MASLINQGMFKSSILLLTVTNVIPLGCLQAGDESLFLFCHYSQQLF